MTNGAAKAYVYRVLAKIASGLSFDDATLAAAPDVAPKTKTSYNKVRNAATEIAEKLARQATKREQAESEAESETSAS